MPLYLVALALGIAPSAASGPPVKSLLEMRRERVVVQQWDLSCGAAALTTLLNFQHGDSVSEREVARGLMRRQRYVTDPSLVRLRQGFSLLDLKRYVERRGYRGVGFGGLNLEDLENHAPIIVPISQHGYHHFVVFRGAKEGRVLLADPAWGSRTMRAERFERAWIDYPGPGKVGFVVERRDGSPPPNRLELRPEEFLMLQ